MLFVSFVPRRHFSIQLHDVSLAIAALDLSEVENVEVSPGEITIISLGIFHRVISIPPEDENFLRLNFYRIVHWRVPIDPTKHYCDSKFQTTVHKRPSGGRNLRRRGEYRKS